MPDTKQMTSPLPYASSGDFHRIFNEEKDNLYQLSFLLTADHEKAQQCFVSGLEDAAKGNSVFKEWAQSWARRVIIQNAVRVINPRPPIDNEKYEQYDEYASPGFNSSGETLTVEGAEIGSVLDLEPFERFVFVMLVLEHYSEHECSILLGCPRRDVIAARVRGLQRLRSATELHAGRQVDVGSAKPGSAKAGSAKPGSAKPGSAKAGSAKAGSTKPGLNDNCRSAIEDLLHV
jgi:DNA-directed RNA polymerase specialized sigma24 family protein